MRDFQENRLYKKCVMALCIAAVALLTGCARPAVLETETSSQPAVKSTPASNPEGLKTAFGKDSITVAVMSDTDDGSSKLFFEGARAEAGELGITIETNAAGERLEEENTKAAASADAVIARITGGADNSAIFKAAGTGIPVCVYGMSQKEVPERVSHIYYSPGNEAEMAYDAALSFPPHDTPVRLILMFESKETKSYEFYKKLFDEGKIFPKEVYIASQQGKKAVEWLTEKLSGYVEGMIDGVYAENTELAIEALGTLEALSRDDMEVFCPGVTAETLERMAKNPSVFVQSAGENEYLAGALCVRAVLKMLKGEGAITLELKPCVITASGLKDGYSALLNMGGAQSELFIEEWMEGLQAKTSITQ